MTQIVDISPNASNTTAPSINHSVTGRMLSIAPSPDGQAVYAGSYSNLWASSDAGRTFEQLTWPQPATNQFDVPSSLGGWCVADIAVALGWRVEKHPRFLASLTASGHYDIIGFGDSGVWTALGNGDGSFKNPNVVLNDFGYQAGGWQVDKHPRFVVDLAGNGGADIVGFGDAGVWTARGNGDGTFQTPTFVLENFGVQQGWQVALHPRFLAVLTASGHADIVGFGDAGVWTALGNGDGTFQTPNYVLANFGTQQAWQVEKHVRLLAPLTPTGFADIVGFGDAGVWTALSDGHGNFAQANFVLENLGYNQGWRTESHPRLLAPLTSSGHADIIAFGDAGVWTALADGDGNYPTSNYVLANFGTQQGWQVDEHPRFVTPLTSSGFADIVGFGDAGVWTAIADGHGNYPTSNYVLANFGTQQGWQVDMHPRFVTPLTSRSPASIIGFGDAGVWSSLGDTHGGFPTSNYILNNFGYQSIVLAITVNDRAVNSRGIWRSPDGGTTWTKVHQFPSNESAGQLQWALGSDHLVYAAGGSSIAISKDAGATFQDVLTVKPSVGDRFNHVAVWQNLPSDPAPTVVYALGNSTMYVSFDGGGNWTKDRTALPPGIGAPTNTIANATTPHVMVISPRNSLEVFVILNGSSDLHTPTLYRGDYSQFQANNPTSVWTTVPVPSNPNQDSGNVFLTATQPGRGDLLFFSPQRMFAYVGPIAPSSASDWQQLDSNIHYDLHGMALSSDFAASLTNGVYQSISGTVWILSDGGIYYSTNGGKTFTPSKNAHTLSCCNVAGVSVPGAGPAFSLNSGDNDGFYSLNGGANWTYQQYGGGDNDCSYTDPLRSYTMLVMTPRWDTAGNGSTTRNGQTVAVYETTPGSLPDASNTSHQRIAVTGPPLLDPSIKWRDIWNADSVYAHRGFRPIVLGLSGETPPAGGDYIFILFNDTNSVLVRTQNIRNIAHRTEWATTATGPGHGANVFLQGPPLPHKDLGIVQASGGHQSTVFYIGGDASLTLWTWTAGAQAWKQIVPAKNANAAVRFFVDPYRPNLIYILDYDGIKRSDDGGATWTVDTILQNQLTWGGAIAISSNDNSSGIGDNLDLILTDMQFDPNTPLFRFAVGEGGAFFTSDAGATWIQLLHTGAITGRPANCYYDWITDPGDLTLYVAFAGRSLLKISQFYTFPIF